MYLTLENITNFCNSTLEGNKPNLRYYTRIGWLIINYTYLWIYNEDFDFRSGIQN